MEYQYNGFWLGVILTLIVVSLFWGIGKKGRYEGMTAEEWFDEYDYSESQLESCEEGCSNLQYNEY